MRVTVERPLVHKCPHRDELDVGTVRASWDGDQVELHALAAMLDEWAGVTATHECVTDEIALRLAMRGAENVEVVTQWTTAGMAVNVTAGRVSPDG